MKLKTMFCGLEFRSPIVVAAGVHGRGGTTIKEVSTSGVAGLCTKTIFSQRAVALPLVVNLSGIFSYIVREWATGVKEAAVCASPFVR